MSFDHPSLPELSDYKPFHPDLDIVPTEYPVSTADHDNEDEYI